MYHKRDTRTDRGLKRNNIPVVSIIYSSGSVRSYWSRIDYCRRYWDKGLFQCKIPWLTILKLYI